MEVDVTPLASLFADHTRAAVIDLLMSGRPHSAGELARSAGVSASTMSGHLQRLLEAGLVDVRQQGRHRYYRLADPKVARAYEALALASRPTPIRSFTASSNRAALAEARSCYDHLAGRLGCQLNATLLRQHALEPAEAGYRLTPRGIALLAAAGVDVEGAGRSRRRLAYPCLDWTERRDHLGGALGAAVLTRALGARWIERLPASRAVRLTTSGGRAMSDLFGLAQTGAHM